jgi:hypothetical protein
MRLKGPELLTETAQLFQALGYDRQAVDFYYRALLSDSRYVKAHQALLDYFTSIDDKERATLHRQQLAKLQPQSPRP